jgi:hypothetical protein
MLRRKRSTRQIETSASATVLTALSTGSGGATLKEHLMPTEDGGLSTTSPPWKEQLPWLP